MGWGSHVKVSQPLVGDEIMDQRAVSSLGEICGVEVTAWLAILQI